MDTNSGDRQKSGVGYEPLQLPPCRICSGVASGLHYGVNTCEACKAFYRRAMADKYKYVCAKDGNCEIIDRKRGNCSACRLKKCIDQGMSRDAVRHGRYTVAIRTKTILEVKKLEAENAKKRLTSDGESSISDSQSDYQSPVSSQSPMDQTFSPIDFESFSTEFDADFLIDSPESMVVTMENQDDKQNSEQIAQSSPSDLQNLVPVFDQNFEELDLENIEHITSQDLSLMEALPYINAELLMTTEEVPAPSPYDMSIPEIKEYISLMVEGHDKIYPRFRKYFDKKFISKLQTDFYEKWSNEKQSKTEIFGITSNLSNEEYNSVYLATGIDVDGRMETIKKCLENIQKGIVDFISYSKVIPGFNELQTEDKLGLIKGSRFEYWFLGHFVGVNRELGVSLSSEFKPCKMDECKKMFGCDDVASRAQTVTKTFQSLNLSFEEVAVLKGVVLTFRDRCFLHEPEKVEAIQWNLIQCMKYLIARDHPDDSPTRRFSKYMDGLTVMRELTELNKKCNRQLEALHWSIIKSYPLVYECYSSDKKEIEEGEGNFLSNIAYVSTSKGSFIQL